MNAWQLAWRSARREWRLPEVRTLLAALLLAVVALGTVATLAARVERAIVANAAQLLGADAAVSAPQRIPDALERAARARGLVTSRTAAFPTMAFAGEQSQMLDITAVTDTWPLRGTLEVADAANRVRASHGPAPGEVYLDQRALIGLGVAVGDAIELGGETLRVAACSIRQPDGGELVALAPRAIMNLPDARRMGLLGAGSRASHRLLVAGAPGARKAWQAWAAPQLPANAKLITPRQVQQRMSRVFERASAFLHLAALLAALLAAVAIALAARQYAQRKVDEVALLRALGMPQRRVGMMLGLGMAMLALPAAAAGAGLALGLAQTAWQFLGGLFGEAATRLPLAPTLAASLLGLALLAGFALPPLMQLARVAPVAIFRRQRPPRRWSAHWPYLLPALLALGLIWLQSQSLKMAAILAAGLLVVALLAMLLAFALLWLARSRFAAGHPALRLALASLGRRRGLSVLQATALALGLTAMLTLGLMAPALLDSWRRELPATAPNWFALNLQPAQRAGFTAQLDALGATAINMMPMATGKLTAINGTPIAALTFPDADARRRAEDQVRLSWSAQLADDNHVVAGRWHGAAPAQAEVSVAANWAERLDLKLGDTLSFRIGASTTTATITSLREVDWGSFRVNFFLVLDPAHAGELPYTWLASFHLAPAQARALAPVTAHYPNLSLIDVSALLDQVRDIIGQVGGAVRWVLLFSLLAGALVLAAALAATQRERQHEAALLRTLGAHRRQLRLAAACEFALLGTVAGLTGAAGSVAIGAWLAHAVFHIRHFLPPWAALTASVALAAVLVMLLGLAGTRRVTRTPPLTLLRRA